MRHHFPGGFPFFWHFGAMALLTIAAVLLVLWLLKRRKTGPMGFAGPPWHGPHPGHPGAHAGPPMPPQPGDALRILDERLARGDIDVDDYLARRSALLGDRPTGTNGTEFTPPPDPGEPRRGEPDAPPAG